MPRLSSIKLTERVAQSAAPREVDGNSIDHFLWDKELRGFGLRIKAKGKTKSWLIQYRRGSRQRRYAFGQYPALNAHEARGQARALLAKLHDDHTYDPSASRKEARREATVAERYEGFLAAPALLNRSLQRPRKERTVKEYGDLFRRFIIPALGSVRVSAVTQRDVQQVFQSLKDTPRQANHCLAVMRAFFSWALGSDAPNPARGIAKHEERRRERFLSPEELGRLGKVLANAEGKTSEPANVIAALRLLIFTGARRSEILTLKWEYFDKKGALLRLPDSKTGAKLVRLSSPAIEVLSKIKRKPDNPFIIASDRRRGQHLDDLERPWRRIRAKAGFSDVRLHDLRHSFASMAVTSGHTLPVIGKLLGHAQSATTERYAHLADDPLRAANEKIGEALAEAIAGREHMKRRASRGKQRVRSRRAPRKQSGEIQETPAVVRSAPLAKQASTFTLAERVTRPDAAAANPPRHTNPFARPPLPKASGSADQLSNPHLVKSKQTTGDK